MTDWKERIKQKKSEHEGKKEEIDFKCFKDQVMSLLESVVEEYRTPMDRLYPQVWGTQPNSLTFGISLDKVFQLHFTYEQMGGQEYIQINKWVVDPKFRRQVSMPVKQFIKVPSINEVEEIILNFLDEYHNSKS